MEVSKRVRQRIQPASKAPVAHGVGRRKAAIARVWLTRGTGDVMVNGKEVASYFDTDVTRTAAVIPFAVLPVLAKQYNVNVNLKGGGLYAQADAMKLGMARALLQMHEDAREILRANNLLTVDSRVKERKKYGQKAARRRFQFVKR